VKELQGCMIVALQGCVIVALQGCVIVVLQGCVIVLLRARLHEGFVWYLPQIIRFLQQETDLWELMDQLK
jgi:hypothetical protein